MEVTPYLYDAIIHEQVKLGFTGKGVDGMPGNDTLSKLIPVQGENLQIAEKRYFVQLKNGKIDVQTV
ncbi:MAG: hypothetical protein H6767_05310 [Candidatus Peribacteria bacterium]|nr:MAG: hypothetical protein H6767_05310 [Candidatus Peribacteria bacterium]